jgi:hypothetical protein
MLSKKIAYLNPLRIWGLWVGTRMARIGPAPTANGGGPGVRLRKRSQGKQRK